MAIPLQVLSIVFIIVIILGLPIFFFVLIRRGVSEINKGGYLLKKTLLEGEIERQKEAIKNIELVQSIVRGKKKGMEVPEKLRRYENMGKAREIPNEIKRLKKPSRKGS